MLKTYTLTPSLRSHALSGLLKITSKQTPQNEKTEARCRAYIDRMRKLNTARYPSPEKLLRQPVEENDACGMQTFFWNKQDIPDQKVILYLHGGAYMNPPTPMHFKMLSNITSGTRAAVVFPVYPKIPTCNYQDTFPKLLQLYDSLCQEYDPRQITIMGDSSGGGLGLGFAYYLRDLGRPQPRRLVLICPWLDLHTNPDQLETYEKADPTLSPWRLRIMGEMWAGGKEEMSNPYVSPIFGDPAKVAPITLFVGTREVIYPDVMKFHRILDEKHLPHTTYVFNGMTHDFPAFPLPEARMAQKLMIRLLNVG